MYIRQWLEQNLTKMQCFIVIDEALKRYKHYDDVSWEFKQDVYTMFTNLVHNDELESSMKDMLVISEARGIPVQNFGQTDSLLFVGINNRLAIIIFQNLDFITRKKHLQVYGN